MGRSSDAYAVLRIKDYRAFITARFLLTLAIQMQSVIVGWQIYELTKDPLSLGLIGLAEIVPFLAVAIYAGHIADIASRKKIILIAESIYILCATSLLLISIYTKETIHIWGPLPIYAVIVFVGLSRAFLWPAMNALVAQLVPRELYANSSTWNSVTWEIAAISGPAIGGLVYGFFGIKTAYLTVLSLLILCFFFFQQVKNKPVPGKSKDETLMQSITSGIKFVFSNQIVLSAISLDMFAVLFGGAISMLPVFASDILKVGPQGLGFLRAAPAIGAIVMALFQTHYSPMINAGKKLLFAVLMFGVCIIGFAISRNFYLSFALLALSGMFDNISVVIRATIIQLYTPDEMRGRVSSVNSIFIGSSNELGSFESGVAAKIITLVPSVIFGGCMTLLVAVTTAKFAPNLRKLSINPKTGHELK
jgi:MFS family permease